MTCVCCYVAASCGDSFQAPTPSCARRAVLLILFGEPEWWPCVGMWGAAALASLTALSQRRCVEVAVRLGGRAWRHLSPISFWRRGALPRPLLRR